MDTLTSRDLAHHLNRVHTGTTWPAWTDISRHGVELVEHPDSEHGIYHCANGDVLYPTTLGWEVLDQARTGGTIHSGTFTRIHQPGIHPTALIHPTARVHPTACIESGVRIGPRAVIGADTHIGHASRVGKLTWIDAGVYIGTGATIRSACHIGPGAVIGTGSDIGATNRIGTAATIPPGTTLGANEHYPAYGQQPSPADRWNVIDLAAARTRLNGLQR